METPGRPASDIADPPGPALPPAVADALRPVLPHLADEIIEAIGREVEAYRRPFEGAFGRTVRRGVEQALTRFVNLIAGDEVPDEAGARVYVDLGRGEYRQGRTLDALLAAYRLGARLAWRRFAAAGHAAGLEPVVMYRVGEAVFAYIDGLSAESAAGYAEAQSQEAGERQRRRRELVALLRQRPAADEATVRAAADGAGWPLPATLAAVVTGPEDESRLATRLGADVLAAAVDGAAVALVPDPAAPGRRAQLESALAGHAAALGPTVPWPQAADSVERAALGRRLAAEGVLPDDRLVATDENLVALLLHADAGLARDLADRHLAALDALGDRARGRLQETLRAWLDRRGRAEEVAHELGVHPQTVRYRVNQLRDLLGPALDDPDERLALTLALRVDAGSERETAT